MSATKNKKVIYWVVETALLIALLIVAQLLSFAFKSVPLASQFVTGSLVNLVLIVGAATVGFSGAAVAAVLSPVLAVLMGQMKFPPMIPVVIVGNLVLVVIIWIFLKLLANPEKSIEIVKGIAGIVLGAAAKCAFLWAATSVIMVPLFFHALKPVLRNTILMMFSWPQGVTALIGGILALLVLPAIRAYRRHRA